MNNDWQVGDLALCVDDGPLKILGGYPETDPRYVANLRKGECYRITHVVVGNFDKSFVGLGDKSKRAGGCASRFRKIRPDEHEACEEEFRILLQLSKKRVSA